MTLCRGTVERNRSMFNHIFTIYWTERGKTRTVSVAAARGLLLRPHLCNLFVIQHSTSNCSSLLVLSHFPLSHNKEMGLRIHQKRSSARRRREAPLLLLNPSFPPSVAPERAGGRCGRALSWGRRRDSHQQLVLCQFFKIRNPESRFL